MDICEQNITWRSPYATFFDISNLPGLVKIQNLRFGPFNYACLLGKIDKIYTYKR